MRRPTPQTGVKRHPLEKSRLRRTVEIADSCGQEGVVVSQTRMKGNVRIAGFMICMDVFCPKRIYFSMLRFNLPVRV